MTVLELKQIMNQVPSDLDKEQIVYEEMLPEGGFTYHDINSLILNVKPCCQKDKIFLSNR